MGSDSISEVPTTEELVGPTEILATVNQWYRGDLHAHSTGTNRGEIDSAGPSENVHDINRVLDYAKLLGLEFVCFAEHSSNPGDPRILVEDHPIIAQIRDQNAHIRSINENRYDGVVALSSVEANIVVGLDGEPLVDVPDQILSELDFTVASIHAINNVNKRDPQVLKALLLTAVRNPYVDEVGHPYRHVEFYPNDWNFFKKYWEGQAQFERDPRKRAHAQEISDALKLLDTRKDYDSIRKIIGKTEILANDPESSKLVEYHGMFSDLDTDYWQMWEDVLAEMEETGTVFEINLNTFNPASKFHQRLIEYAARHPNLNYSIVFDFHNTEQQRKDIKEKDLTPIKGPLFQNGSGARKAKGRELAVRKLYDTVILLKSVGIVPEKVINTSFLSFESYRRMRNEKRAEYSVQTDPELKSLADPNFLCELLHIDHIDGWKIHDFVRSRKGQIEKVLIEISSDEKIFRIIHNRKFPQGRVYEVMENMHDQLPEKTIQPLGKKNLGGTAVIAYEAVSGSDLRSAAETMSRTERIEMIRELALLTGEIHAIDPSAFEDILNHDNSSLEQIINTINKDTIARIASAGQESAEVVEALSIVYAKISEMETEILGRSTLTLIHGDWHPGNVIRKEDGSLCVIDYKSFTYGVPERDVASMLQQIHDQFLRAIPDITEEEIIVYQNSFLDAYPHKLDPRKLELYKAWISWRNALFHYSRHYLGGKYNDDGRRCLAQARKFLT